MCPSYMATRNEKDTTRARANILREFLTRSDKVNRFDHEEIKEVMDLCLSCKGCKSECPSNVDVAKLKAEFLQHYYDANGVPLRTKLIANFTNASALGSKFPALYNFTMTTPGISTLVKKVSGFAAKRSLPTLHKHTLKDWIKKRNPTKSSSKKVLFFCDEFTNYNDTTIGIKAIELLQQLGYSVQFADHEESGRTWLSKGLLRDAKKIIDRNIKLLSPLVNENMPMVGVEPSAILSFRDEYPELCDTTLVPDAIRLSKHCWTIEEFLSMELDAGRIDAAAFTDEKREVLLHGHCQQKAMSGTGPTAKILSIPRNYSVKTIPSGCCGMAGSFGYEAEHYDLSMQIGELVLFPAVRNADDTTILAAPGTSCRHQIKDGTGKLALHPVEVLWDALA